ncbi:MAG: methionyl-tRNA formyltransferase [Pyrinomonadaceae bacterium]
MKIVFMGTPLAAVPTFERLVKDGHEVNAVYTQPDRPSGRGNKITFSPVKQFAHDNQIPVFQPAKIKTPEALATFESHNADVAVVVAYGRILPETFLNAFPYGAVNVHFSLLPKYRGAAPVNWAIANGETKTGVTTMKMDAGLDTGDILLQSESAIGPQETAPELMERLSMLGAELLSETLLRINEVIPQKQDNSAASFAPILRREDGLIDWQQSACEINNRVRGFQPFPSSYTYFKGQRVTIWKAKAVEQFPSNNSVPGTAVSLEDKLLTVCCGNGSALAIEEIQPEGKRRISAVDFINGNRLSVGDRFGTT